MEDAVSVQQKEQLCYYELGNYGNNLLICLPRRHKKKCIHPVSKPLIVFQDRSGWSVSQHAPRERKYPPWTGPEGKPGVYQMDGKLDEEM